MSRLWFLLLSLLPLLTLAQRPQVLDSLAAKLARSTDPTEQVWLHNQIAKAWYNLDMSRSWEAAEQGLTLAREIDDHKGQIFSLNLLSFVSRRRGHFEMALEQLFEAERLAQAIGNDRYLINTRSNLGLVYWETKDYPAALTNFRQSLAGFDSLDIPLEQVHCLNNLGLVYKDQGQLDSALIYHHRGLARSIELAYPYGIASHHHNLGNVYRLQGKPNIAIEHLYEAMPQYQAAEVGLARPAVFLTLGRCYLDLGQFDSAAHYLTISCNLAQQKGMAEDRMYALAELATLAKLQGRPQAALAWLETYLALKDSLFNAESVQSIAMLKEQFNLEKARLAANILLEQAQAQSRRQRWWFGTGMGLLTLLSGAVIWGLSIRNKKNRLQRELAQEEADRLRADERALRLQQKRLEEQLQARNRELATKTLHVVQKNELLASLSGEIKSTLTQTKTDSSELRQLMRKLEQGIASDEDWEEIKLHFEQVNPGFFDRLMKRQPKLTPKDLRLAAYLRMNLSTKEIASLLNFTVRGVETHRYRLRKKLELSSEEDLVTWMMRL